MEKIQETDEGYYVQHGDVLEWHWKNAAEPAQPEPVTTETAKPVAKKRAARKSTRKTKK